jgi:hypothetical protein
MARYPAFLTQVTYQLWLHSGDGCAFSMPNIEVLHNPANASQIDQNGCALRSGEAI